MVYPVVHRATKSTPVNVLEHPPSKDVCLPSLPSNKLEHYPSKSSYMGFDATPPPSKRVSLEPPMQGLMCWSAIKAGKVSSYQAYKCSSLIDIRQPHLTITHSSSLNNINHSLCKC